MKLARLLMVMVMAALATPMLGCARKVVLDPVLVPARNDPAWKIQRQPRPARTPSNAMQNFPARGPR